MRMLVPQLLANVRGTHEYAETTESHLGYKVSLRCCSKSVAENNKFLAFSDIISMPRANNGQC